MPPKKQSQQRRDRENNNGRPRHLHYVEEAEPDIPQQQQQQQQNVNNQQQNNNNENNNQQQQPNRRPPGPGRQQAGRTSQVRNWMFTLWRDEPPLGWRPQEHDELGVPLDVPPEDWRPTDNVPMPEHLDHISYQQEEGPRRGAGQNRRHWQGYLEFDSRLTYLQVMRIMGWTGNECHLEPRMGTQKQAIDYVTKEGTRVGESTRQFGQKHNDDAVGGWEAAVADVKNGASFHDMVNTHTRIAIQCHAGVQKAILALAPTPAWRQVETIVFWGGTGVGKTRGVYEREGHQRVYAKMCSRSGSVQWFDGYNGEPVLLLDEFKAQYDLQELLRWLDGHPLRVEIKGSNAIAAWKRVYICSNIDPSTWYASHTEAERAALWRRIPAHNIYKLPDDLPRLPPASAHSSVSSSVAQSLAREPSTATNMSFTMDGMGPPSAGPSSANNSVCRSRDSVQRTPWIQL